MGNSNPSFTPDKEDVKQNRLAATLAYFIFFLPLVVCQDSVYAKYHANQGLIVFIACVALNVFRVIPFFGWIVSSIASTILFILAVIGAVSAYQGECKPLPYIGTAIEIIK